MKNDLDTLLRDDLLQAPPDFTERLMQRIQQLPQRTSLSATPAQAHAAFWSNLRRIAAMTGLIGAGALGLGQIAGFVFGLWLAGSAI